MRAFKRTIEMIILTCLTMGTVIFPASMPVHAAGTWDFYSEDDILHAMASADVDDRILRISLQV